MKKILLLLTSLLFLSVSCDIINNFDYPEKVVMPSEGGTKIVRGSGGFQSIGLHDENFSKVKSSERFGEKEDSTKVVLDWLTAKGEFAGNEVIITAEPNTTGKKRILRLGLSIRNSQANMEVVQY